MSFEDFQAVYRSQSGRCQDTGVPFNVSKPQLSPSPDRIDNLRGYVSGNLRFVTWRINNMRGGMTVDEFHGVCELVARRAAHTQICTAAVQTSSGRA